jgi:hypothetical protein
MESMHLIFRIKLEEKHRLILVAARYLLKKNRGLLFGKFSVADSVISDEYTQSQLIIIMLLNSLEKNSNYINAKELTEIIHHLSRVQDYCLSFSEQSRRELYASVSVCIDSVYDILGDFFDIKNEMLP